MGLFENNSKETNSKYTESITTSSSTDEAGCPKSPPWLNKHSELSKVYDSAFDSTPFSNLLGSNWEDTLTNISHFTKDNMFQDFFQLGSNGNKGKIKSAMKAFPVPNTYAYKKCQDNNGLSVWDENGWWRCLFPRDSIKSSSNSIELSREDVEADSENKHGLFFKDYSSLLDWKVSVRNLIQKQREEERKQRLLKLEEAKSQRQSNNVQNMYNNYSQDSNITPASGEAKVVSSSKSSYFTTLPNGDFEEIIETNKVFDNGDNKYEKVKKIYPNGGGKVIVENLSDPGAKEGQLNGSHTNAGLNKWIWGSDSQDKK
ncbi:hypothetical protein WICPIJ_001102 [Wickerhamomyces pijperi]|uniref:Mitochondrial peculiar membrane protein 1 n=1 Tax=Wickerhamomyces pijperi TaxID=599730 RepID=A0A9P8QBD5_WICPI|nr:hypothetical protein WICPIJ_001102 [Wickerhamomyces pijperi]